MFGKLWQRLRPPSRPEARLARRSFRPRLERLEDRTLLSIDWVVNAITDTDSGDATQHTGTLRYCVENAAPGDAIVFDPSLNGETILLNSEIQLNQNPVAIVGEDLNGNPVNVTVSGQNHTRLFEALANSGWEIDFLTLTGGNGSGGNGGALLVDSGAAVTLDDDTFLDNATGGNGGAIENDGTAYVEGCAFQSNSSGGSGGAIENTSDLTTNAYDGTDTVYNDFTSNTAVTTGGAIDSSGGGQGQLSIGGAYFYSNTAANGGAIATVDSTTLDTDIFGAQGAGNSATSLGGNGGAVYALQNTNAANQTQLSLSNCTMDDNMAAGTGSGGAIYTTMSLNVQGGEFGANIVPDGGGGAIEADAPAGGMQGQPLPSVTITGATLQNNQANSGNGGAIGVENPLTLTDDTFNNNTAKTINGMGGSGGAIITGIGAQDTLNGCNFTSNSADTVGGAIENRGMLAVNSSANNLNPEFVSNTAGGNGGAIDSNAIATGGFLNVSNADFVGNRSLRGSGGAINTADPTILSNDLFGDKAGATPNVAATNGGAVSTDPSANPTTTLNVWDSQFNWNQTASATGFGGAIDTADVTDVERSTFLGNQGSSGGAIAYTVSNASGPAFNSSLIVNQSLFTSNSPFSRLVGNGGAVFSSVTVGSGTVNVSITSSTFTLNGLSAGNNPGKTNNGGGVDIEHDTSGTGSASARFFNDTFFSNQAFDHGGGLALSLTNTGTGQNTAVLTSLTIYNNQAATDGGGVFASAAQSGVVFVRNCILDGNIVNGFNGAVDFTLTNGSALFDVGYNLCGSSNTDFIGMGDITDKNNNPGLAKVLAQNNALPGYTTTLALQATSPGYEKGDPTLAGQMDERGFTRQNGQGSAVSIGAEDPDATIGP